MAFPRPRLLDLVAPLPTVAGRDDGGDDDRSEPPPPPPGRIRMPCDVEVRPALSRRCKSSDERKEDLDVIALLLSVERPQGGVQPVAHRPNLVSFRFRFPFSGRTPSKLAAKAFTRPEDPGSPHQTRRGAWLVQEGTRGGIRGKRIRRRRR